MFSPARMLVCLTGTTSEREFFPNKVFLYLSYGLSIVSMFDGERESLIDEQGLGFNFQTSDQLATGYPAYFPSGAF